MTKEQNERISRQYLIDLSARLDSQNFEILRTIYKFKFMTASQLQRIFFTKSSNNANNLRTCNRRLKKLQSYGVIDCLIHRIGGARAGSRGKVWVISSAGFQLLKLDSDLQLKANRKRLMEPSILFLEHTLTISEAYTKLIELDHQKKIELLEVQHEPRCWRTYSEKGVATYLKPDLYVSLALDEYVDHYFLELDRATEPPSKCIVKAKQYIAYANSAVEQRQNENGVFPFVVWIVPNEKRREQLTRYIRYELPKAEMLFRVITMAEFETLIAGDSEESAGV
ncbi:replication-relaxation family protein [Enterococcus pallens]|uniref:Replication-relaxation n=1 Tax=Enterococcus pallens ATCC BAA-351 TaxID=1158607 RepID=R2T084_9ENTE|nr:replication-relaxation family protein [Enterococcus pallens]EOH93699.1 hypothetical protein UAU_02395 [Enterococcus pallens ATCC BAA-351]EOU24539.1 hypothetical protein I588_00526 [Enterococcus pallens ATCC BAA-351]OJG78575.1 hypothetical protein RV10_GL001357 [Enterococcus pallens]